MWLERISGGGVDLIDLQDAKDYLRLLGDETDTEVAAAISASSDFLDVDEDGFGGLGFPLVAQQWALKSASFGTGGLRLPFARIASVDEVRYMAADGHPSTVSPQDYLVVKCGRGWRIELLAGKCWPEAADRPDAVEVRFTSGWPSAELVPGDIKQAARVLVGFYFETRTFSEKQDIPAQVSSAVDNLTRRYRRFAI